MKYIIKLSSNEGQKLRAMFTLLEMVPEMSGEPLPTLALTEKRPWSLRAFSTKHLFSNIAVKADSYKVKLNTFWLGD